MIDGLKRRYCAWRSRQDARRHRKSELARLRRLEHALAHRLASAIADTAERKLAREDETQIERIERLRESLARSTGTLEHIDYGAGQPDAPRDRAEARKGVPVTLEVSRLATRTSKSRPWSDLIYNLVRKLEPDKCLEMGTCVGLSAAYQCAAMTMSGKGLLVTLEGGPALAELARANLSSLGFTNFEIVVGPFEVTLEQTLQKERPIDFIFNDGHHDGDAMLAYFEETLPYLSEGSVMLFDDIAVYASMRDGWRQLTEHPAVDLSIDFGPMGLVCVNRRATQRSAFTMPLA